MADDGCWEGEGDAVVIRQESLRPISLGSALMATEVRAVKAARPRTIIPMWIIPFLKAKLGIANW